MGFLNRIIHFVGNRQTKGEDGDGYYHTQKISWIKCSQSSHYYSRGESEIYHLLTLIAKQKQMCCIPDSAQLHSDSTMLYMSHPHFYAILQWPPGGPSSFSGQEKQYI